METKGGWKVKKHLSQVGFWILDEQGKSIGQVYGEANAHLMAASKDMYEALKDILSFSELSPHDGHPWVRGAPSAKAILKGFEALAKAEEK